MAGTLITVSDAFRAALVAAGNTGTNAHKVVSIGLATAAFDASKKTLTKLPNELKRITSFGGQNIAADTIHVTLLDDTADQYSLFGFGFYLEDGTLAAYYSQPAAIMEKSPAAQLLLSIDSQFASIDAATLSFPAASFLNPPASETVQGVIELATQDETDAGTDDLRAITPKKAAARFAPLKQPTFTGPVIVNGNSTVNGTSIVNGSSIVNGDATTTGISKVSTRALFGPVGDDGATRVQVDGSVRAANYYINSQAAGDSGLFGFNNASGPSVAAYGSGTSGAGSLVMRTAGIERARFNGVGRFLIGTTVDDGVNLLQVAGSARMTGQLLMTGANASIEIGSSTANNTPYLDFHSSGSPNDYDARIIASGGTAGTDGVGALTHIAANTYWRPSSNAPANMTLLPSGRLLLGVVGDDGANQLQLAGTASINGDLGGSLVGPARTGVILGRNGGGSVVFKKTDAPTDQKLWDIQSGDATFQMRTVNDAWSAGNPWLQVTRGAGNYVNTIQLAPTTVGRVLIGTTADDGGSRLQVAGNATVTGTTYSGAASIDGGAGGFSTLFLGNGGKPRWTFYKENSAESGGNAGSNLCINYYADDGATQTKLFQANRNTGTAAFTKRFLVGTMSDDGANALQVNGNSRTYGTAVSGAAGSVTAWVSADATYGYFRTSGHATMGSEKTDGYADIFAGNAARVRVLPSGRVMINTTADDGTSMLQVNGAARVTNSLSVNGANSSSYAAVMLNSAPGNFRFLQYLSNGVRRLEIGGNSDLETGNNAGTNLYFNFFDDAGNYLSTPLGIKRNTGLATFSTRPMFGNATPWDNGNLTPLDVNNGGTLKNDIYFDPGKRIFLSEGSAGSPSLTFQNDGAPDTGFYHIGDGSFGVTCNSTTQVRFTPTITYFDRPVSAPTPAAGDNSMLAATTAFVTVAMLNATVGQIVFEPRTAARAGYLKLNGALVKRTDYPALWAYAQASGALVTDAVWGSGSQGCFSSGDGATTFRIPELRGEFLRCWDDSRGVDGGRTLGSFQDSQNRSHAHGASSAAVGDHAHSAWTDAQGAHSHGGGTGGVGDHQHGSPFAQSTSVGSPWGYWDTSNNHPGLKDSDGDNSYWLTSPAGGHNHSIPTDGSHGHNVGINGAGSHAHTITVNADGGNETRVRNVAVLAMIRAF